MSACRYVGRVGALAFAFGVGAAVFGGTAVGWADADVPGATAGAAGSAPAGGQARDTGPSAPRPRAVSTRAARSPLPAAATTPTRTGAPAATRSATALTALPAVPAPSLAAPGDQSGGGNPVLPADSPLDWTVAAFARRGSLTAASTAAPTVAATGPTQPLVIGPSGVPIPSLDYVDTVMQYYIVPNSPDGTMAPQRIFTPEGLYPITGVKSLPLNTSADQGMTILSDTLAALPAGTPTTVFGYSQSAIIGSLLQDGFVPPKSPYPPPEIPASLRDVISFIFVGNEMNPNGGFLSRFPDLQFPSLGLEFYGATPENNYPTTNYTLEYDGFADFPRYPLNFLSVLNADMGIVYVHTKYAPSATCQTFCLTEQQVRDAIALPTTSPTQKYYFIPTENLPLLQPLRAIPLIGNPIADLIQPVLKVIVDLGYADPAHGFETGTQPIANVLVPFGLFPNVSPLEVLGDLAAGVVKGIGDFIADFGPTGSIVRELSAISLPTPTPLVLPAADGVIGAVQGLVTSVANAISGAVASLYSGLLPTADIVNALVTSLPAYDVALALEGVKQILSGDVIGGLINAIGLPIAANVGLVTTSSLVGALVWAQAIAGIFGITIGA